MEKGLVTTNVSHFIELIELNSRLIAIDLGTKQIGIAISNKSQTIVEDYFQFQSNGMKKDLLFLAQKYNNDNADSNDDNKDNKDNSNKKYTGIIIGSPFSHTRENNWIKFIDKFILKLSEKIHLPICIVDESYSTQSIKHLIQNFSKKRQKKWKDKLAASCILEETLCTINDYRTEHNNV